MELTKIKNKGQGRLFRSELLEMMTKTHPFVVYTMYFPVIFYMLYIGATREHTPTFKAALLFICGVLFWTLFEYIIHRYVFHIIAHSSRSKRLAYTMHGVHHEYPRDKDRLFMPPVPSALLAIVIYYSLHALMGAHALAFFPGFLLGYMAYGSMHYAIHAFAPPKMLKALWRNHHLHHYKHPDKGFGVSSMLWDVVFRTVPDKGDEG